MKHALHLLATALLASSLAACDAIGDGSTIETLEILPASGATQLKRFDAGDTYKVFQCLRDELFVKATFTDGTEANFGGRAIWSSSDPSVVEVSNGDIPAVFLLGNPAADGSFYDSQTTNFLSGTLIPRGTPGQTAVITARFSNLSASINVEIRKPTLRIVNVPNLDPGSAAPPYYLAEGTTQRLTVLADADGRTVKLSDLDGVANSININPLRWVFTGGTFVPEDPDVIGDADRWAIDSGTDRIVTIGALDATVTGVKADFTPYEVYAESSLCQGSLDPALRPIGSVQVATLYDDPGTVEDDRLVLTREASFNGGGFATEDMVIGTNQQFQLRAKLDAEGDGSLIVDQHFNLLGRYQIRPVDAGCDNVDELLGCTSNSMLSIAGGFAVAAAGSAEGTVARLQACTPLCQQAQATLAADDTTVGTGVPVNFTATALSVPAGITVNYLFDFGDGTTLGPQASALASHAYATADFYTATVRLVDAAHPAEFLSQNAGAVRVLAGVSAPAGNTAPVAELLVSNTDGGDAPFQTLLDATGSSDPNAGDSITVYEFDPGDGTPLIRQSRPTLQYTYVDGTGSPFTPGVRVYDESGAVSPLVSAEPLTVNGAVAEFIRSNTLDVRGRAATLCAIELQPPLAAAASEAVFTFPGQRFEALGSFIADTDTEACTTDPVIGTQRITRFMVWTVRPEGATDGLSDYVQIRANADDFQVAGQVVYSEDVTAPTLVDVDAFPQTPFSSTIDAPLTQFTVTPCVGCTP
jgi:hypothetical protein